MTAAYPDGIRERARELRRESIRAAILSIVAEPKAAVTVAEICERAVLSRPTFYAYYDTLGAALLDVFVVTFEQMTAAGHASMDEAENGRESLLGVYRDMLEFGATHPQHVLFSAYLDYSFRRVGMTEEQVEAYNTARRQEEAAHLELFRRGQSDGSIREDLDPAETLGALGSSLAGLLQRTQITDEYTGDLTATRRAFTLTLDAWRRELSAPPQNTEQRLPR